MRRIWLRNIRRYAIVDDEDYSILSSFYWAGARNYNTWYATCYVKRKKVYMHRMILGSTNGKITDHVDRNGLNNRKNNIRHTTTSKNALNARRGKHNSSGYKGVNYNRHARKWVAQIEVNKVKNHIGYFDTKHKAAKARREYERKLCLY